MSDIMLHTSTSRQVTCVSNTFIDNFMKDANGEYVKIYLYMLRCLSQEGMDFSISAMADKLDHTQRDIKRALEYWERQNLLRLEYDEAGDLIGICLLDPYSTPVPQCSTPVEPISPVVSTVSMVAQIAPDKIVTSSVPQQRTYSSDELAIFSSQAEVKEFTRVTEMYIGKPLKNSELQTLMFWYDELQMSVELIEYLVEYCISKNHSSFHYMNKVAINWAEAGIKTVSQAKGENELRSEYTRAVAKAFGISGRNLTDVEMDYVKRWEREYGFPITIVQEALNRTILTIQKPSFDYADSILRKWHQSKVHTLEDVQSLDATFDANRRKKATSAPRNATAASNARTNRFRNFDEREYDYDALEAKLLQKRR